jgi:hypothetical protein
VTGHALVVDGGITLGPNDATRMATFAPVFGALGIDAETVAAIFNPPKRG